MQKLKSNKGSTLVAVVVFAIVAAIGAAGYMHVMSNTVSHEVDALNDEKAYQTAESGLLIGIRWLIHPSNYESRANTPDFHEFEENGMVCKVSLEVDDDGIPTIYSRVTHEDLPYTKILSFSPTTLPLTPGTLIDKFPEGCKDEVLTNIIFDGHVHSNEPIKITSADYPSESRVEFKDNVSLYNPPEGSPERIEMGYVGGKNGEETYRYGVLKENLKEGANAEKLDNVFRGTYDPFQGKLEMPEIPQGDYEEFDLGAIIKDAWTKTEEENVDNRIFTSGENSFLYFYESAGRGYAKYVYLDNSLATPILVEKDLNIDIDGKVIISPYTIGVIGKIKGNVTVQTDDSYKSTIYKDLDPEKPSIIIMGDLVYDDFSPILDDKGNLSDAVYTNYSTTGNYGVGTIEEGNSSLITLVSHGNIQMGDIAKLKIAERWYNSATGGLEDSAKGAELIVTAVLIAKNEGYGLQFKPKKGDCEISSSDYDYTFRHIGSRVIDTWSSYFSTGASRLFYLYTDSRINDYNFRGPGIPNVRGGVQYGENGLVFLVDGIWAENDSVPEG